MAGVPKAAAAGAPATKAGVDTVGQIARDAKAHHAANPAPKPAASSTSSTSSTSSPQQSAARRTDPNPAGPNRQQSQNRSAPPRRAGAGPLLSAGAGAGSALNQGAGFLLAAILWAWVGLPFLKGGPSQVKAVLMAKLFNKDPKGQELN
jgi:hypothetical protein